MDPMVTDADTPTTRTRALVSDWRKYREQAEHHVLKHRRGRRSCDCDASASAPSLTPSSSPTSSSSLPVASATNVEAQVSPLSIVSSAASEGTPPPPRPVRRIGADVDAATSSVNVATAAATRAAEEATAALAQQRADTEEWREAFLRLQEQTRSAELARDDQERHRTNLVRAQVERELALARQKSVTLAEQVKALELSAEELLMVTNEKEALGAELETAQSHAAELEATVADLRTANTRLSEGLDAAMLTTRQTRERMACQEETNRDMLLHADQRAGKAENALATAEKRIRDLQEQLDAALRGKADAESRCKTLEEQITMERTVASEKIQEFAGKLQNTLTSRDESMHTYQLALEEGRKKQAKLEAEVRLLQGNPSEARKLRKRLRHAHKRLAAFERTVGSNTEELQRHAIWLQKQVKTSSDVFSAKVGTIGTIPAGTQGRSLGILLSGSSRLNSNLSNNRMEELNLQSNAGQNLLFQHALSVM